MDNGKADFHSGTNEEAGVGLTRTDGDGSAAVPSEARDTPEARRSPGNRVIHDRKDCRPIRVLRDHRIKVDHRANRVEKGAEAGEGEDGEAAGVGAVQGRPGADRGRGLKRTVKVVP